MLVLIRSLKERHYLWYALLIRFRLSQNVFCARLPVSQPFCGVSGNAVSFYITDGSLMGNSVKKFLEISINKGHRFLSLYTNQILFHKRCAVSLINRNVCFRSCIVYLPWFIFFSKCLGMLSQNIFSMSLHTTEVRLMGL